MMTPGDVAEFGTWVGQFAAAVAAYGEIEGMKAENSMRERHSESPAYVEEHFITVLRRYGMLDHRQPT